MLDFKESRKETKKDNYYTFMFFLDMDSVSPYLIKAIRCGVVNANYTVFLSNVKNSETILLYEKAQPNKPMELPTIKVQMNKDKKGVQTYSGGYSVNGTCKVTENNFSAKYAEDLFKQCKQMIANKEISRSRIVSI